MSDLLIKGMKIPSCCDRCFYRCFCSAHARQVQKIMESDAVQIFDIFGEMRLEDCPLVEVKQVPLNNREDAMRLYVDGVEVYKEVEHGLAD